MYKEHRRLYFDSSLRKWNQEVLSDNDYASSEFSSLCEWDCGVENLEHVDGDVYSDEDISGAEHILIEHVLPVDHGVQQNAVNGMWLLYMYAGYMALLPLKLCTHTSALKLGNFIWVMFSG